MTPEFELDGTYSPLSGWDEYPIHQSVAPLRYVAWTDPRAFERYWFTAKSRDGSAFLITGLGVYPNLGVTDAYVLLMHRGRQISIRAHQPLSANRASLQVGPIRFAPARPFAEWHLSLEGGNEHGLSFDLKWFDTKRARFSKPPFSQLSNAPENMHLLHDWGGYESFGEVEGEIRIGDEMISLTRDRFVGSRDHHWGIRDGVGGLNLAAHKKGFTHCGQFVEFRDWAIWGAQILYPLASPKRPILVDTLKSEFAFDSETRHFREGIVTNRQADGEIKTLHYKAIDQMTAYLRCAGYAGPDGRGSPTGNYLHGIGTGPSLVCDAHDLSDSRTRIDIAGFEDQLCLVTCDGEEAIGIFECQNPALYEMCKAGVPGFSFLPGGDVG